MKETRVDDSEVIAAIGYSTGFHDAILQSMKYKRRKHGDDKLYDLILEYRYKSYSDKDCVWREYPILITGTIEFLGMQKDNLCPSLLISDHWIYDLDIEVDEHCRVTIVESSFDSPTYELICESIKMTVSSCVEFSQFR
ncbi:MAG: hypothetical protein KDC26_02960 [Armatimonadetes bacterium]|nr:hypothetical protein [Armatimonadota bacterium]